MRASNQRERTPLQSSRSEPSTDKKLSVYTQPLMVMQDVGGYTHLHPKEPIQAKNTHLGI